MKTVRMEIPLGYKLLKKEYEVSVDKARELFLSKKQNRITVAERDDYSVKYQKHYIECPYCNHRVNAYARDFNKAFGLNLYVDSRVEKEVILDWTSQQIKIFEEPRKPLHLSRATDVRFDLTCPKCKNTIHRNDKTRTVEIIHNRHKVFIRTEVLDIMELVSLPCLTKGTVNVVFPLFEVAGFNFKNGHSYIRLETAEGKCLAVRDLTYDKYAWTSGSIYNVLLKNKYLKRTIRNIFNEEWNGKIPFYPSELGIDKMRLLTQFMGYDKKFYSAIPVCRGSLAVEESFKPLARKMRNSNNLIKMFSESKIPNMKSVKKIFFNNMGLFFYLDEVERLWDIFNNPNYFVKLLSDEGIYQILSDLHMRPILFDFIKDSYDVGGARRLLKTINENWASTCRYGVTYSSMSESMRKSERKKWIDEQDGSSLGGLPFFAIPMSMPNERIRDCIIDDFEFSWLKSSVEYEEVGTALSNCLTYWSAQDSPVICVRKAGKIVAALEVRNNYVYQAYTARNQSLQIIPGLENAYKKWHQKYNLSTKYIPLPRRRRIHQRILDINDDLPFG